MADEIQEDPDLVVEPTLEHFDYICRSEDLIHLGGRKYHGKRNHINKFLQTHAFAYSSLEERHLPECLKLGGFWCEIRKCEEDMNLMGEWEVGGSAGGTYAYHGITDSRRSASDSG